jgi:hypothetical protein
LLALGREHPDRLLACLLRLEAHPPKAESRNRGPNDAKLNGAGGGLDDSRSRGLKKVIVSGALFVKYIREPFVSWVTNIPDDASIVRLEVEPLRKVIVLTIRSKTFESLEEGMPIPEQQAEFASDPR